MAGRANHVFQSGVAYIFPQFQCAMLMLQSTSVRLSCGFNFDADSETFNMNKVLLALATGFVAGILLAPDKGSVTRQRIYDSMDDLTDKLADLKSKFVSEENRFSSQEPMMPKVNPSMG